jgi:hypothetical protein
MQTPKMMATRVTRHNYDVVAAIAPGVVARYDNSNEIYGEFIVINEPGFVSTEFGSEAIALTSSIMTEEEFDDRFAYSKKENPFGKGFIPVRHKTPKTEEPSRTMGRILYNQPTPRPKRYPRR